MISQPCLFDVETRGSKRTVLTNLTYDLFSRARQEGEMVAEVEMEEANKTGTAGGKKQKGRGFKDAGDVDRDFGGKFESLETGSGPGPAKSVEGWIILVTNVHEEAQEDDIHEAFAEFGEVKNMHLNLDRRTGFVKGYALIEYDTKAEAAAAIAAMNGKDLALTAGDAENKKPLGVEWAFSSGALKRLRK